MIGRSLKEDVALHLAILIYQGSLIETRSWLNVFIIVGLEFILFRRTSEQSYPIMSAISYNSVLTLFVDIGWRGGHKHVSIIFLLNLVVIILEEIIGFITDFET